MALWLVRHGETEWSLAGRHTGATDVPLTPEGELQAVAIGTMLRGRSFAAVRSSPRMRTLETCRLAGFGERVEVEEHLAEVDYGEYEGLTTAEIQRRAPGWELFRDGSARGERPEEIRARADAVLDATRDRVDGDVLVFGHGHFSRALATRFLGLPVAVATQLRLDPGSISVLGIEREGPSVVLWNRRVAPRPVLVADLALRVPDVTE